MQVARASSFASTWLSVVSLWLAEAKQVPGRGGRSGDVSAQLSAFFRSALILASSVAVNSLSVKVDFTMAPLVEVRRPCR